MICMAKVDVAALSSDPSQLENKSTEPPFTSKRKAELLLCRCTQLSVTCRSQCGQ